MKLIQSFDNWERMYESAKTDRGILPLNEADDMFTKVMEGIKSSMAYAKATGMMKRWEELSKAANESIISLAVTKKTSGLAKQVETLSQAKANAKGAEAKAKAQEKINKVRDAISDITDKGDELRQQAANEKDAFKETLDDLQKQMKEPFSSLYAKQLSEINRTVLLEAAKAKGELAAIKGDEAKSAEAKKEAQEYATQLDKIKKDIADGRALKADDLEELDELKPYLPDINKIQASSDKVTAANKKIDGDTPSSVETAAGEDSGKISEALTELKSRLEDKKAAQEDLYDSKKGLYDKIKDKAVTKTVIILAGGNTDKAEEADGGWKIGELNNTWGEPGSLGQFISKDKYTESTQKEIDECDEKLQSSTETETETETETQTASYSPNVSGAYQVSESIATRFKRAMDQRGPRL
jgi:hypothetical protein